MPQMKQNGENDFARELRLHGMAGDEQRVFLPCDAGAGVALGLLERMAAKGAERFARVSQVSLVQQMKPHLDIHNLPVSRIKPPPGVRFAKQDRGRFAHQVFSVLHQTSRDDFPAIVTAFGQGPPNINHFGLLIQNDPGRRRQSRRGMPFQQCNHFAQGLGVAKFVVPEQKLYVFSPGLFQAAIPIVDHSQIGGIDRKTNPRLPRTIGLDNRGGVVGRAVVHDEHFEVPEVLRQH